MKKKIAIVAMIIGGVALWVVLHDMFTSFTGWRASNTPPIRSKKTLTFSVKQGEKQDVLVQAKAVLPRLIAACPGLNTYADDFSAATVSQPAPQNPESGIRLTFTVAQKPVLIPSPLNTYSAGNTCFFEVNKNGTVVSIAKKACFSLCEGIWRNDQSGNVLDLSLDKPSSVIPKTQAERKEEISRCFSSWDGSHRKLTDAVRDAMHDPKSFEHVETRYRDGGDRLFLSMTFRGKNKFGAMVKNLVTAEANMDCTIIKLEEVPTE